MSFEDIENKLIALGTDAGDPNYFLNIANLLANLYDKNFSNSKLKKIFHSSNNREDSSKDMRLDLTSLNLPLNSIEYLDFSNKFTLKLDDSSYIIINLKGLVEEFIIDGHPTYFRHQLNISEAYELLDTGSYYYDKNSYFEFLYSLYTTSLIYCEDWLNNFFTNTCVNISDYLDVNFYSELFDWKEEIPLASIYEMKYLNVQMASFKRKKQVLEDPLYNLYCLFRNRQVKKEYTLPEGIIAIHRLKERYNASCEIEMLDSLYNECQDKTIIMPNTLKSIIGDFFEIFHNPQVVFNAELQELHQNSLSSISKFQVPNGIKVIDKNAFISNNALIIEISDYKNSSLLNDEELLKMFICNCYKACQTIKQRIYITSDKARKEQELYKKSKSAAYPPYLSEQDYCTYITFELKPKFNSLIVEDENGNEIILNLLDLTCESERCRHYGQEWVFSEDLNDYEVLNVIDHIRSQIAKKLNEVKDLEVSKRERKPE